jgi:hypothetical protein
MAILELVGSEFKVKTSEGRGRKKAKKGGKEAAPEATEVKTASNKSKDKK